jgi:hypothetical protein
MDCKADDCGRKAVCRGCCDKHYRRLLKRGSIDDFGSRVVDEGNDEERFHKKYSVSDAGCWIWFGGSRPNSQGVKYPRHWSNSGRSVGAHRFSYELKFGPITNGMYVCHKCDTPMCVNPDHLFLGTHKDNMKDMVNKGRSFKGRGENCRGRAKLTNKQAKEIRGINLPQSKIADMFNVSQTTIGRIKRGESY